MCPDDDIDIVLQIENTRTRTCLILPMTGHRLDHYLIGYNDYNARLCLDSTWTRKMEHAIAQQR